MADNDYATESPTEKEDNDLEEEIPKFKEPGDDRKQLKNGPIKPIEPIKPFEKSDDEKIEKKWRPGNKDTFTVSDEKPSIMRGSGNAARPQPDSTAKKESKTKPEPPKDEAKAAGEKVVADAAAQAVGDAIENVAAAVESGDGASVLEAAATATAATEAANKVIPKEEKKEEPKVEEPADDTASSLGGVGEQVIPPFTSTETSSEESVEQPVEEQTEQPVEEVPVSEDTVEQDASQSTESTAEAEALHEKLAAEAEASAATTDPVSEAVAEARAANEAAAATGEISEGQAALNEEAAALKAEQEKMLREQAQMEKEAHSENAKRALTFLTLNLASAIPDALNIHVNTVHKLLKAFLQPNLMKGVSQSLAVIASSLGEGEKVISNLDKIYGIKDKKDPYYMGLLYGTAKGALYLQEKKASEKVLASIAEWVNDTIEKTRPGFDVGNTDDYEEYAPEIFRELKYGIARRKRLLEEDINKDKLAVANGQKSTLPAPKYTEYNTFVLMEKIVDDKIKNLDADIRHNLPTKVTQALLHIDKNIIGSSYELGDYNVDFLTKKRFYSDYWSKYQRYAEPKRVEIQEAEAGGKPLNPDQILFKRVDKSQMSKKKRHDVFFQELRKDFIAERTTDYQMEFTGGLMDTATPEQRKEIFYNSYEPYFDDGTSLRHKYEILKKIGKKDLDEDDLAFVLAFEKSIPKQSELNTEYKTMMFQKKKAQVTEYNDLKSHMRGYRWTPFVALTGQYKPDEKARSKYHVYKYLGNCEDDLEKVNLIGDWDWLPVRAKNAPKASYGWEESKYYIPKDPKLYNRLMDGIRTDLNGIKAEEARRRAMNQSIADLDDEQQYLTEWLNGLRENQKGNEIRYLVYGNPHIHPRIRTEARLNHKDYITDTRDGVSFTTAHRQLKSVIMAKTEVYRLALENGIITPAEYRDRIKESNSYSMNLFIRYLQNVALNRVEAIEGSDFGQMGLSVNAINKAARIATVSDVDGNDALIDYVTGQNDVRKNFNAFIDTIEPYMTKKFRANIALYRTPVWQSLVAQMVLRDYTADGLNAMYPSAPSGTPSPVVQKLVAAAQPQAHAAAVTQAQAQAQAQAAAAQATTVIPPQPQATTATPSQSQPQPQSATDTETPTIAPISPSSDNENPPVEENAEQIKLEDELDVVTEMVASGMSFEEIMGKMMETYGDDVRSLLQEADADALDTMINMMDTPDFKMMMEKLKPTVIGQLFRNEDFSDLQGSSAKLMSAIVSTKYFADSVNNRQDILEFIYACLRPAVDQKSKDPAAKKGITYLNSKVKEINDRVRKAEEAKEYLAKFNALNEAEKKDFLMATDEEIEEELIKQTYDEKMGPYTKYVEQDDGKPPIAVPMSDDELKKKREDIGRWISGKKKERHNKIIESASIDLEQQKGLQTEYTNAYQVLSNLRTVLKEYYGDHWSNRQLQEQFVDTVQGIIYNYIAENDPILYSEGWHVDPKEMDQTKNGAVPIIDGLVNKAGQPIDPFMVWKNWGRSHLLPAGKMTQKITRDFTETVLKYAMDEEGIKRFEAMTGDEKTKMITKELRDSRDELFRNIAEFFTNDGYRSPVIEAYMKATGKAKLSRDVQSLLPRVREMNKISNVVRMSQRYLKEINGILKDTDNKLTNDERAYLIGAREEIIRTQPSLLEAQNYDILISRGYDFDYRSLTREEAEKRYKELDEDVEDFEKSEKDIEQYIESIDLGYDGDINNLYSYVKDLYNRLDGLQRRISEDIGEGGRFGRTLRGDAKDMEERYQNVVEKTHELLVKLGGVFESKFRAAYKEKYNEDLEDLFTKLKKMNRADADKQYADEVAKSGLDAIVNEIEKINYVKSMIGQFPPTPGLPNIFDMNVALNRLDLARQIKVKDNARENTKVFTEDEKLPAALEGMYNVETEKKPEEEPAVDNKLPDNRPPVDPTPAPEPSVTKQPVKEEEEEEAEEEIEEESDFESILEISYNINEDIKNNDSSFEDDIDAVSEIQEHLEAGGEDVEELMENKHWEEISHILYDMVEQYANEIDARYMANRSDSVRGEDMEINEFASFEERYGSDPDQLLVDLDRIFNSRGKTPLSDTMVEVMANYDIIGEVLRHRPKYIKGDNAYDSNGNMVGDRSREW